MHDCMMRALSFEYREGIVFNSLTYVFTYSLFYDTSKSQIRPPLWSSGQSSWFDSRRYQISSEVVGLERGPLSLVRIIEELLEWKSGGSGLGNRNQRP
jgi:hypothetical protein